jgi:hypothetical protein
MKVNEVFWSDFLVYRLVVGSRWVQCTVVRRYYSVLLSPT